MLISDYAIRFRVAVFVMMVVLAIAGTISYITIPREGTPDITIPYVFLTATYEGTAPTEMEKLVTIPLEKTLKDAANIKEMRSSTAEGFALVSIEFLAGQDIDRAKQEVKDKIDMARPDLPADLDEPVVQAINFSSDFPILITALSGGADPSRMKYLAEAMEEDIETVPGVKDVSISGLREREIRVEVDLRRLATYGVPIEVVMARITRENKTVSAGNVQLGGTKFQVRVPGEFGRADEIGRIMLLDRADGAVYVSDVADVTDTFKDADSVARLNGEPALSLTMRKRSGINTVSLVEEVQKRLKAFPLPNGVRLTTVFDMSDYVRMMIAELENNVFSGFALVFVVLLLFMGTRNSMFVALAIPFSLMVAFVIMSMMGESLNMIVLFSLVLAVGMLVDNGIVIVENIYRNRNLGKSALEASLIGTAEVAWPVTTSTITTVVAFLPLLFWPGIMGQFMGFLPRTVIVTLLASLFVALVMNPAVCSVLIKPVGAHVRTGVLGEPDNAWLRAYERFLRRALGHPGKSMVIGLLALIASIILYARFGKGVELFPETEPRNATVQVRFPQGTRLERTDETMLGIEKLLGRYEDIKFYLTTVGGGGAVGDVSMSSGAKPHEGRIHIEFKGSAERKGNSLELVEEIRKDIGVIAGAELKVEIQKEGPPTAAPVAVEISGDEFDELNHISQEVIRRIETVPGLVDVQDDFEDALPELQFHVDRNRAALFGLDTDAVGNFLRTAIYGSEVSKFRAGDDEFDITVRLPETQRDTGKVLEQLWILTLTGKRVPVSSLGGIEYVGGRGSINRKDQKRMVTVTGNNQGRGVDLILKDVRERLTDLPLQRGYTIGYAGDTKEMAEAMAFLTKAFWIALGLIFVTLVMEFNSLFMPGTVMTSVIMSLVGVLVGLLVCNMRFGIIMTGVGVISLAGVVVNNAIVLIDCALQRRRGGATVIESIVRAARLRMRPVLLTASTTILGLVPMAVGWSMDIHTWPPTFSAGSETSSWWAPMAVVVIFGLALATVLTLVFVPVLYVATNRISAWFSRLIGVDVDPVQPPHDEPANAS